MYTSLLGFHCVECTITTVHVYCMYECFESYMSTVKHRPTVIHVNIIQLSFIHGGMLSIGEYYVTMLV